MLGAVVRVVPLCDGRGSPWAAVAPAAPGWGATGKALLRTASGIGLGVLSYTPGCRSSVKGISPRESKLEWSHGLALHPRGQHRPAEEPSGSPKKSITCFNFGIRQEEDGFVSSATPFQLFPERQRLEEVAGPNYNIREPAPVALPGFVPAAGTGSSSRALRLTEGFPPCSSLDGPAPSPAQDGGLWSHLLGGVGRGWHCQTAVSGRRCDGERGHRALPRALPGTGCQAALSLAASTVPNCRWR